MGCYSQLRCYENCVLGPEKRHLLVLGPILFDPEFHQLASSQKWTCFVACTPPCVATRLTKVTICAVLAFVEPISGCLIPVDYSIDLASLYANVLVAIVVTKQNLYVILSTFHARNTGHRSQDIGHTMRSVTAHASYVNLQATEFEVEQRIT
jgi:hypothetical protein